MRVGESLAARRGGGLFFLAGEGRSGGGESGGVTIPATGNRPRR